VRRRRAEHTETAVNVQQLANIRALVVGLGASGRAAGELLRRRGAIVVAIDGADTPSLRAEAGTLRALGVDVRLGVRGAPSDPLDLAVVSPGVPVSSPVVQELHRRHVPVIGELELGFQQSLCLNISITGPTARPPRRNWSSGS